MSKAYTYAQRLAAAFLARLNGSESAATAFAIDPRTVRSWQQQVPVPDDAWEAIQAVLQARAADMAAQGETRGLVQTLTGAGIASRNVRYAKPHCTSRGTPRGSRAAARARSGTGGSRPPR